MSEHEGEGLKNPVSIPFFVASLKTLGKLHKGRLCGPQMHDFAEALGLAEKLYREMPLDPTYKAKKAEGKVMTIERPNITIGERRALAAWRNVDLLTQYAEQLLDVIERMQAPWEPPTTEYFQWVRQMVEEATRIRPRGENYDQAVVSLDWHPNGPSLRWTPLETFHCQKIRERWRQVLQRVKQLEVPPEVPRA